jgi:spore germination cell wall hydrolase CwlJ-like protein
MRKFMNNFLLPAIVFFGIIYIAYLGVMWGVSRIKHDPANHGYVTMAERDRQIACLASNILNEASGENAEGKVAVAQITLNRANSGRYPNDVCRVVYQKNQFSWTSNMPKALRVRNQTVYKESEVVAKKVLLEGYRLPSLHNALFYHATWISQPAWAKKMKPVAKIGQHVFYEDKGLTE